MAIMNTAAYYVADKMTNKQTYDDLASSIEPLVRGFNSSHEELRGEVEDLNDVFEDASDTLEEMFKVDKDQFSVLSGIHVDGRVNRINTEQLTEYSNDILRLTEDSYDVFRDIEGGIEDLPQGIVSRMRMDTMRVDIINAEYDIVEPMLLGMRELFLDLREDNLAYHHEHTMWYARMVDVMTSLKKGEDEAGRGVVLATRQFMRHPVWYTLTAGVEALKKLSGVSIKALFGWGGKKTVNDLILEENKKQTEFLMTGQVDQRKSLLDQIKGGGLVGMIGRGIAGGLGVNQSKAQRLEQARADGDETGIAISDRIASSLFGQEVIKLRKQGGVGGNDSDRISIADIDQDATKKLENIFSPLTSNSVYREGETIDLLEWIRDDVRVLNKSLMAQGGEAFLIQNREQRRQEKLFGELVDVQEASFRYDIETRKDDLVKDRKDEMRQDTMLSLMRRQLETAKDTSRKLSIGGFGLGNLIFAGVLGASVFLAAKNIFENTDFVGLPRKGAVMLFDKVRGAFDSWADRTSKEQDADVAEGRGLDGLLTRLTYAAAVGGIVMRNPIGMPLGAGAQLVVESKSALQRETDVDVENVGKGLIGLGIGAWIVKSGPAWLAKFIGKPLMAGSAGFTAGTFIDDYRGDWLTRHINTFTEKFFDIRLFKDADPTRKKISEHLTDLIWRFFPPKSFVDHVTNERESQQNITRSLIQQREDELAPLRQQADDIRDLISSNVLPSELLPQYVEELASLQKQINDPSFGVENLRSTPMTPNVIDELPISVAQEIKNNTPPETVKMVEQQIEANKFLRSISEGIKNLGGRANNVDFTPNPDIGSMLNVGGQ